ncbi:MAG TPA: glycosyltransferase family 4 protein [Candidatus Limnocylindria bacterium]|nr:glycosyltransferase family 4 protein [Candidatus Limnocylindria bacterium]
MRIVIAKKLLSTVGGSEAQARALARALHARGHEVRLVGLRPAWPRPGIPSGPRGDLTMRSDGVDHRFLATPFAAIDGILPTSLIGWRRLARELAGADVVHSIAREWAGPLERATRSIGAAFVETPLVHPGQRAAGDGRADVARYRRADAVLALTEWEAGWYRERGARNVYVTGVGAIVSAVPDVPMDPATVLFVGRKERYKGYDALRDAAALVWRARPDARFHVIGQRRFGGPRPLADPRWHEPGVVGEEAKAAAYARATIFCMPSEHETFGHTYLEAWCAKRPVIAGDIPPLREVVREGIDGVHARNDPADIARAILALLGDPARAARMGAAGHARVLERWTWDAIAERTERAYADARGLSRAPR